MEIFIHFVEIAVVFFFFVSFFSFHPILHLLCNTNPRVLRLSALKGLASIGMLDGWLDKEESLISWLRLNIVSGSIIITLW